MLSTENLSDATGELDDETIRELAESARPYGERTASALGSGTGLLLVGGLSVLRGLRRAASGRGGALRALGFGALLIGLGVARRRSAGESDDRTAASDAADNPVEPTTVVDGMEMGEGDDAAVDVDPEFELNESDATDEASADDADRDDA